jgi:hypothetical protein
MCSGGYAGRNENGKTILMHRQIMQPPKGMLVDHMDRNKANNCRPNLRLCTPQENQRNKRKETGSASQFKGVFHDKRCDRWYAKYRHEGKYHWLGFFDLEVDAARAYDRAAVQWYGEFARLNFPEEWPPERRAQLHAQRDTTKTEPRRGESSFARKSPGPKTAKADKPKAQRGTKPARRKTNNLPQRPQRTQKPGTK